MTTAENEIVPAELLLKAANSEERKRIAVNFAAAKPGFGLRGRVLAQLRSGHCPFHYYRDFAYDLAEAARPGASSHPLAWMSVFLGGYFTERVIHHTRRLGAMAGKSGFTAETLIREMAVIDAEGEADMVDAVFKFLGKNPSPRMSQALVLAMETEELTRDLGKNPAGKRGGHSVPKAVAETFSSLAGARGGADKLKHLAIRLTSDQRTPKLKSWGNELEALLRIRGEFETAARASGPEESASLAAGTSAEIVGSQSVSFFEDFAPVFLSPLRREDAGAVAYTELLIKEGVKDREETFKSFKAGYPGQFALEYFRLRVGASENAESAGSPSAPPMTEEIPMVKANAAALIASLEAQVLGKLSPAEALKFIGTLGDEAMAKAGLDAAGKTDLKVYLKMRSAELRDAAKSQETIRKLGENLAALDERSADKKTGLANKIRYCEKIAAEGKLSAAVLTETKKLVALYKGMQSGEIPEAAGAAGTAAILKPPEALSPDSIPTDVLKTLAAPPEMESAAPSAPAAASLDKKDLEGQIKSFDVLIKDLSREAIGQLDHLGDKTDQERFVLNALRSIVHDEKEARELLFSKLDDAGFNPRAFIRWMEVEWFDDMAPKKIISFINQILEEPARLVHLIESYPGLEALLAIQNDSELARAQKRIVELLELYRDSFLAEMEESALFRKIFDGLKLIDDKVRDKAENFQKKSAFLSGIMADEAESPPVRKKARQLLGLLLQEDETDVGRRKADGLIEASRKVFLERSSEMELGKDAVDKIISHRVKTETAKAEEELTQLKTLEAFAKAMVPSKGGSLELRSRSTETLCEELLAELFRRAWVPKVKLKFIEHLRGLLERRKLLTPGVEKILAFHMDRLHRYQQLKEDWSAGQTSHIEAPPDPELGELAALAKKAAVSESADSLELPERYRDFFHSLTPETALEQIKLSSFKPEEKHALLEIYRHRAERKGLLSPDHSLGFGKAAEEFRKSLEASRAEIKAKAARKTPVHSGADSKAEEVVDLKEYLRQMDLHLQEIAAKHVGRSPRDMFSEQFSYLQKERQNAKSAEARAFILKSVIPRINYAQNTLDLLEKLTRFSPEERTRSHYKHVLADLTEQFLEPIRLARKDQMYFNAMHFSIRYKAILGAPVAKAVAAGLPLSPEVAGFFKQLGILAG